MDIESRIVGVFVAVGGLSPLAMLSAIDVSTITGDSSIGAIVGALAGGGFSLWYGWYVTTNTIPRIVKESRDQSDAERTMFREEMAEYRRMKEEQLKSFREELKSERDARERESSSLSSRLQELGQAVSHLKCHGGA